MHNRGSMKGRKMFTNWLPVSGNEAGFTLTELIVVIVIIAIAAVMVTHKLATSPTQVSNISSVDQAVADIRYAQARAIATRSAVSIRFRADGDSRKYVVAGETKYLPERGSGVPSGATFTFNSLGEYAVPVDGTVTVGGTAITVYRITGKVAY